MKRLSVVAIVLSLGMAVAMGVDKLPTDIPKWMHFVEITGSNVNLRMQPSIEGEKLVGEYFAKGEVAPLLDETDEWTKVYYAYSPTQYVWVSKQFTREAHQEPLPDGYQFTTFLTYGDKMLTYKIDGKLTNIVYKYDYPFETARIRAPEPDLYKKDGRFMSRIDMGLDWNTLMPRIIETIPDKCVYKHLRGVPLLGESHNFRTDYDPQTFGPSFYYSVWIGDGLYMLSIHALPTNTPNELILVALSESGLDGMTPDVLASMRYNIKTGEYSDIQEGLPGVVIDKLGLDYSIFKDHPEYQRELRQSPIRHITISDLAGIPMVSVSGAELSLFYPIDTYEIEGYTEKTNVYYLWDGQEFVKLARSPYIDMLYDAMRGYYDVHSVTLSENVADFYTFLMPHFVEAWEAADAASEKTGKPWLEFDPFTFLPKGQKFGVFDIEVITAANRSDDKAKVTVYPVDDQGERLGEEAYKTVIIEAMYTDEAGNYAISDFKDENGVSVLEMARLASGQE